MKMISVLRLFVYGKLFNAYLTNFSTLTVSIFYYLPNKAGTNLMFFFCHFDRSLVKGGEDK